MSYEGQQIIRTPNIDKIAEEGLRFENAYSAMFCAPSRASLLTGLHDCHSDRFEVTNAGIYKKINSGEYDHFEIEKMINEKLTPIPDGRKFLGEIAKHAGYRTAQFGKLEWGFATSHQQMHRHGWDHYFGYLDHVRAHGFYPPFLFRNGEQVAIEGNTDVDCGKSMEPESPDAYSQRWNMEGKAHYSQKVFMDSLLQFISENKDHPFFLYFPTQLPHGPVSVPEVHPDFEVDERLTQIEKEYASMVKMLDDNIGQIVNQLEELDIRENTIIIFTSDNGHEIYYAQEGRIHKPYVNMESGERFDNLESKYYSKLAGDVFDGNNGRAGLKRTNLQGGIEVPLIVNWPAQIQAGRVSDRLVANYDQLATIADIVGYGGQLDTDGLSYYDELIHENMNPTDEHEYLVFSSFLGPTLITNEGWKLRSYLSEEIFELYYLPEDYQERNNLSKSNPEIFNALKDLLLTACDGDFRNGLYSPRSNQIRIE